jgi:ABC-2 type transport system ATP-binding protein
MIRIEKVTKRFGTLKAVNDLSLEIAPRAIFGFIGPNGAGKTTTIKMLATLIQPDSGRLLIDGVDAVADPKRVRELIGYMPDFFGVYDDLKVWEYLDFFAAAYKKKTTERAGLVDDVLELTDLTEKKDSYVENLSRGMKQRLCLAKTLIHNPKVLLLDEPASGLDPRARIEFKEVIKTLSNMGKTIFISSHILTELADFCTDIGIMERGNLLVAGNLDLVIARVSGRMVYEVILKEQAESAAADLKNFPAVSDVFLDGNTLRLNYNRALDEAHEILTFLVERKYKVMEFHRVDDKLEDVFMKLTTGAVQ